MELSTTHSEYAQYVWQCQMLIKICEKQENSNDIIVNTVFWTVFSNKPELFMVADMPTETVYKIIAPDVDYWYTDCSLIKFAGVQQRPLGNSKNHGNSIAFRPYYHSVKKCAMYDMPCRKWNSCSRRIAAAAKDATDSEQEEPESSRSKYVSVRHRCVSPTGSPVPEELDEMPSLLNDDIDPMNDYEFNDVVS